MVKNTTPIITPIITLIIKGGYHGGYRGMFFAVFGALRRAVFQFATTYVENRTPYLARFWQGVRNILLPRNELQRAGHPDTLHGCYYQ